MNTIVAKEFDLRGTFRFYKEFAMADDLLNEGQVDLASLILSALSYRDSTREFALASNRSHAIKVISVVAVGVVATEPPAGVAVRKPGYLDSRTVGTTTITN